jgi:short-subunit dehydrogenase
MTDQRPLALVTGASSGIGRELAREFVEHGYDLIVAAEDSGVDSAAAQLGVDSAEVRAVRADLRTEQGVEQVWTAVAASGRNLDAAVLNAGVGAGGGFLETSLADEFSIIDLNVRSTVHLAKLVLRDMASRDDGRVLITSSIASTMPGSYQAVYNASKSFLQSFAQAVASELRDTGVTVTSLMPGPTETNFFHRADMDDTKVGQSEKDDPAQVARQGFDALMKGKDKLVAGSAKTKAQAAADTVLPDRAKAAMHKKMAKPGSADQ